MEKYLVRINPTYSFVKEHIDENGKFFVNFAQVFGKDVCTLVTYRFTFGLFIFKYETQNECENSIKNVWFTLYPEYKSDLNYLIVPYDESESAELMKNIYSAYYGADEYLQLLTTLYWTIPTIKAVGATNALVMRSYLFAIDDGCGFTTLLSSLGDYLSKMGIYGCDSLNKNQYIEFVVNSETDGEKISVNDIISYLNESNDSDSENKDGIIGIDISYFLETNKQEEFRRFLKRLYFFQNKFTFAFRIPFLEKKALNDFASIISDQLLLKIIEIPPLNDCVLLEHFWDMLGCLGYRIDNSLFDTFFYKIRIEKKDGRFAGFKTVEKIANEMALRKAELTSVNNPVCTNDKRIIYSSDINISPESANNCGYNALSELIGMEKITEKIKEIVAQVKVSILNDKLDRPCIHMRFLGSPGTGKTTVARIIGQILKEEGILRKGAFLEYEARALCAEYVGQTAVKTSSICRDAYGSVLFLDEAYSLYSDEHATNDFGKEALTTLISEMENHRDDMLVIMAGYTSDMELLMKGNAGLKSRMPYEIYFPNYTRQQLFEIFMLMIKKHFEYTSELEETAKKYFYSLSDAYLSSKYFANARFVRNLYERTWSKAALRSSLDGITKIEITKDDFITASNEKEFKEKIDEKNPIGF